jgi:acyl carrier protein
MNIRETIISLFDEVLETTDQKLTCELSDDVVLLESGLDSLGFAILVARLEEELDYDPFTMMEEPVYPTTFKEFVGVYEKYKNVV